MRELSGRQKLFVAEYLKDLNGTRAAIAAGYAKSSAGQTGSKLLRLPEMKAALDKAQRPRLAKYNITADRILREVAKIAFARSAVFPAGKLKVKPRDRLRVNLFEKQRALELLARHAGLLSNEVSAADTDAAVRREMRWVTNAYENAKPVDSITESAAAPDVIADIYDQPKIKTG